MRVKFGGAVAAAQIISKVQPVYPEEAKAAKISGAVNLHVVVGIDGAVRQLDVISGPPELQKAATDAVKQWRYKPTKLNGKPVEVDTEVVVTFTLQN
jgi:TonB family protein